MSDDDFHFNVTCPVCRQMHRATLETRGVNLLETSADALREKLSGNPEQNVGVLLCPDHRIPADQQGNRWLVAVDTEHTDMVHWTTLRLSTATFLVTEEACIDLFSEEMYEKTEDDGFMFIPDTQVDRIHNVLVALGHMSDKTTLIDDLEKVLKEAHNLLDSVPEASGDVAYKKTPTHNSSTRKQ